MPFIQRFALNSFAKEYPCLLFDVPTVSLPMVRQTDSGNTHANYFEQLQRCISPTQMAMLGMQVARKSGFSPLFGAAVGVVVGGVLVVVSQYAFEKYYSNAEQYLCLRLPTSVCMGAVIASLTLHGYIFHFFLRNNQNGTSN